MLKGRGRVYKAKVLRLVHGVGLNDMVNITKLKSYKVWNSMLRRCYCSIILKKQPYYKDCSVCEEWLTFSNFKEWFDENYIDGCALDKDLLAKGNKIYSPETCCFIPAEINALIVRGDGLRGDFPIGVYKKDYPNGVSKFGAQISINKQTVHLGYYDTPENAFQAYKQAKESHIKNMAEWYFSEDRMSIKAYEALMRYEVEITD